MAELELSHRGFGGEEGKKHFQAFPQMPLSKPFKPKQWTPFPFLHGYSQIDLPGDHDWAPVPDSPIFVRIIHLSGFPSPSHKVAVATEVPKRDKFLFPPHPFPSSPVTQSTAK